MNRTKTSKQPRKSRHPSNPAEWEGQQIFGRGSDPKDMSCAPGEPKIKTCTVLLDTSDRLDLELFFQDCTDYEQAVRNWVVREGCRLKSLHTNNTDAFKSICEMFGLVPEIGKQAYDVMVPRDSTGRKLQQFKKYPMSKHWTDTGKHDPLFVRWRHCPQVLVRRAIEETVLAWYNYVNGKGGKPYQKKLVSGMSFLAVQHSAVEKAAKRTPEQERTTKGLKLTPGRTAGGRYRKHRHLTLPGMTAKGFKPIKLIGHIPYRVCYDNIREIRIVRDRKGKWYAHIIWQDGFYEPRLKPRKGTGVDLGAIVMAYAVNASTGEEHAFETPDREQQNSKKLRRAEQKLAEYKKNQIKQHKTGNMQYPYGTKFDKNGNVVCRKDGTPIIALGRRGKKLEAVIAKLKAQNANRRINDQHIMSRRIVDNADMLILEELRPKNMMAKKTGQGKRGRSANRKIAGGAIGRSRAFLVQKAHETGIPVVILPWDVPSSKTCNLCHHKNIQARKHGSRIFQCENCGFIINSDLNAGRNIAAAAEYAASQVVVSDPGETPGQQKWQDYGRPKRRRLSLEGSLGKVSYAKTVPEGTGSKRGCIVDTSSVHRERSGDPPVKATALMGSNGSVSGPLAILDVGNGVADITETLNPSSI